jgi:formylglycine-generating enzyme required for sulfatase activity/tRNA A-37 threonylcarbamoyl transferase component Bud32
VVHDPLLGLDIDGRYSVLKKIGAGGMGSIYLARQKSGGTKLAIERDVAIKFLRGSSSEEQELIKRFRSEADIVSKLKHPNTLTFFDSGETDGGDPYFVTEYLEGESLEDRLSRGALGEKRSLEIVRDVCASLEEAHAIGVVHRDLKPANIYLARVQHEEVVKVLDFGIAKIMERAAIEASQATQTGALVGTPAYASPEQARSGAITPQSDLYSLGVVLFECITGKRPFEGNPMRVLVAHADTPPPRPSQIGKTRPEIEDLILRMMAKEPSARPATAKSVRAEIEALLAGEGPKRSKNLLPIGAVAMTMIVGAAVFCSKPEEKRFEQPPPPPQIVPAPPEGMIRFEGGAFTMGSSEEEIERTFQWCRSLAGEDCSREIYERERPQRTVTVAPFYLDVHEATPANAKKPITKIAWKDALAACRARNLRLPTELEWVFAAKAGRFPWGDEEPDCKRTAIARGPKMLCASLASGPSDVGTEPQDVTPEGIHDLGGNVAEWTMDAFGNEGFRVVRGGWWDMWQESARAQGRSRWKESEPASNIGFRCARGVNE